MSKDFLDEMKEDLAHKLRWKRRLCHVLTLGQHWWGEKWRVDVGPIGFEESDDTLLGWNKQCRICYECVSATPPAPTQESDPPEQA